MKKALSSKAWHGIWGAVSALQILLISGAVFLSRLAYTRGGANHHIAYKKRQYNELIFTEQNVLIMQIALAILLVLVGIYLIRAIKRKNHATISFGAGAMLALGVLLFELSAEVFKAISIYPYAVAITLAIAVLQFLLMGAYALVKRSD